MANEIYGLNSFASPCIGRTYTYRRRYRRVPFPNRISWPMFFFGTLVLTNLKYQLILNQATIQPIHFD